MLKIVKIVQPTIIALAVTITSSVAALPAGPPAPTIDLVDTSDSGASNLDNVTGRTFLDFRVSAGSATSVVIKNGVTVVDTFVMPAVEFTTRTLTVGASLAVADLLEGPNPVSVESTDAGGNISRSEELLVTVDTTVPPSPSAPDLLFSSDSGSSNSDNVTNVTQPAFQGTGEANGTVRIRAQSCAGGASPVVGQGIVGADATDGVLGNRLGVWEVTVGPLAADACYRFTAVMEDLAGNISTGSATTDVTLDSTPPQRPTIDLVNAFDTGKPDNVTRLSTLDFRISGEPGTTVAIKDGNTVVDSFIMPGVAFTTRTITWPVEGIAVEGPHPLSAEATDTAGNRSQQSAELLLTIRPRRVSSSR
jgi:hypothetical protein